MSGEEGGHFRPGRILLGLALTALVAVVVEVLSRSPFGLPDAGLLYLVAVVASIFIGGVSAGVASGIATIVLAAVFFSVPGPLFHYTPEEFSRLVALLIATPAIGGMVGVLKRRDELRIRRAARVELLEQYREMVQGLDAIVWERDAESLEITFVSRGAEALLGFPLARMLGGPGFWIERLHAEDRERTIAQVRAMVARRGDQVLEYRMLAADGRVVWLRDVLRVVSDAQGRTRVRAIALDLTERREAERALREREHSVRMLMEQASDGIALADLDGRYLDVNPRLCEMLGYTRDELLGLGSADLIDPVELERRPLYAAELQTGQQVLIERRLRRKDGSWQEVEISATRFDARRVQGIFRDITGRKRTEEALKHTLSLLGATLEATADGILVVDAQGKITSANRRFIEMWGIPETIVASRDDNRAIAFVLDQLRDPEGFEAKVRELYSQPEDESMDVLEFKDGRVFERYSRPQAIAGLNVGRVWSFRDVTEPRRAEAALRHSEEQLLQAQKMEAVGRLAGGVAHDFNNLLTAILGNSSLIAESLPATDPHQVLAIEIQQAAERASTLTRQLLAFSRKQMLELKVLDLNAVIGDTTSMLERMIGENIHLEVALAPTLGRVKVDPGQMTQVLLNLALNARDAMPAGGALTIETANAEVDEALAASRPALTPGSYVLMVVVDTGLGMDAMTEMRIFEPFFTTKERGKGTGLGLSTVYGIVSQSGGDIIVSSEPAHGTSFRIYLPRVDEPLDEIPAVPPPGDIHGDETVLLVEDEPSVRQLARVALAECGYRVLVAEGGDVALAVAEAEQGPLHILVTDVVMPGMSGPELAERLLGVHPDLRVLLVSGYAEEVDTGRGLGSGDAFLQKPFTRLGLARKVREVLDAPHPRH